MKRSNLVLTAAILAALSFGGEVALAQATHNLAHNPGVARVVQRTTENQNKILAATNQAAPSTLAQILADPKTNFHPITLANGIELGPNIPGRIIVGPLNPTPLQDRIAAGSLFLTILLISVVWAVAANREHNESLPH